MQGTVKEVLCEHCQEPSQKLEALEKARVPGYNILHKHTAQVGHHTAYDTVSLQHHQNTSWHPASMGKTTRHQQHTRGRCITGGT